MRKSFCLFAAALAAGMVGCVKDSPQDAYVKIVPSIRTRATSLDFEPNDRIGLTITRASGVFAENRSMTFDGTSFTGGLLWYGEQEDKATLTAYYPYREAGFPAEFTVAADQRFGCETSDLLGAVKTDVLPGSAPVGMVFYHLMSQLTVVVSNRSSTEVTGVTLSGFVPVADVDFATLEATAKAGTAAGDIRAFEWDAGAVYHAVLVPQTADLTVTIEALDQKTRRKTVPAAALKGGVRYDLSVEVTDSDMEIVLSGAITDWKDGGSIGNVQTIDHEGETYRTEMICGQVWMAENLRYKPARSTIGSGVWYPAGGQQAVAEQGLLYDRSTALGGDASAAGGRVRGICPEGWHIPDMDELQALIDWGCSMDFFCCAGYWIVNAAGGKYGSAIKGCLMSTTLSADAKVYCLAYSATATSPSVAEYPPEYGVSVRCVKDD